MEKGRCAVENMEKTCNPLETEPLSRLMLRYSVPTTLTLMVNYLYSIVDQIFVGQGVGITGMAAVNVASRCPFWSTLSRCCWETAAPPMSVCVWGGRTGDADRIFGHAVTWIIASGMLLALLCGIFYAADRKTFRFHRHRLRGGGGLSARHRLRYPLPAHLPRIYRHDTG